MKEDFLIQISGNDKELIRIEQDGTVVISEYGADKKAAKSFYESLQIEGQTLFQKIKDLEEQIIKLKDANVAKDEVKV